MEVGSETKLAVSETEVVVSVVVFENEGCECWDGARDGGICGCVLE